jgi:hypothetical protein
MSNKIHFYGLLHLDEKQKSATNVSVENFSSQIDLYKKNAITLARTLALHGIRYTLLTNRPDLLHDDGSLLEIKEISFNTVVPDGVRFYSAHHKIDVFRYFSSIASEYSVLCDLDVVCLNSIPEAFLNIVQSEIPLCYDISDQVIPAYGHKKIIRDLEFVKGSTSEGRWCGGEFIGGTNEFFGKLYTTILELLPAYIENINDSHHVGDEAIVSPAIELLKERGMRISDGGTIGIISRFWNCGVLHPQKPFAWSSQCFLIHLPADKLLLANASEWSDSELNNFIEKYESMRHAQGSRTGKAIKKLKSAFRKGRKLIGL